MINIVIPMAGRGSRFAAVGYHLPKPLIKIHNTSLIECVTNNLMPDCPHRFIYICLKEHLEKYDLEKELQRMSPQCQVVTVDQVTEGAACTVLLASKYIDNEDALMIANSDQYVDIDINHYLEQLNDSDGMIMTMKASDNKWSFIQYNDCGLVTDVKEKVAISDEATVGIYNYRHGSDFVKYANQMIKKNIRVNNEFYVAPVYQEMIADSKKITYYNVGAVGHGMYGLGTPEDLEDFRKLEMSNKF